MRLNPPAFSPEQWRFLAALDVCGESASPDLLKTMVPIRPESLKDLLTGCEEAGWLDWTDDKRILLTDDVPEPAMRRIKGIHTPEQTTDYINRLQMRGDGGNLTKRVLIKLLMETGRLSEAAETELDLAHDFLKQRDYDQAYQHLGRAAEKLYRHIMNGAGDKERLFVETIIELSSVSFAVGRGMQILSSYLRLAVRLAEASGNVRSHALACLHLGRLLAYLDQINEGVAMLAVGKEEVEKLGDADILKASAEFLGLYFVLQGRYREALVHFERAEQLFTQEEDRLLVYPMILWILGFTLFASGQVPRALGFFQSYWRSARDMGLPAVASIARSILGFSLAVARKRRESLFHLQESLEEARENRYAYTLFIARAGLALQHFHDGDLKASHEALRSAVAEGRRASSIHLYANAYLLDMLASFHHNGFEPVGEGWEYQTLLDQFLTAPSNVQRGIALRRRAEDKLQSGMEASWVMNDLNKSITLLERAGTSLALNDAFITAALLHLREGARKEARTLVEKVWEQLREMGLETEYFPKTLREFLPEKPSDFVARDYLRNLVEHYFEAMHGLDDAVDENELFHWMVRRIGRLIRAERGAFFWKGRGEERARFLLRAGYNITGREIKSEAFKPSLELIHKSFRENRYIRTQPEPLQYSSPDERIQELLCLPVQSGSEVKGVLYFDDSYLSANFDFLPAKWAPLLIRHTSNYISRILTIFHLKEETNRLSAGKSIQLERRGRDSLLAEAPVMLRMLGQVERAARAEATLLITGETGTGKELMVYRMHQLSSRSSGPFIVVDSTAIPENLVESELFGHEKGAFTGADAQKRGLIELAHQGTLFIDEIGELPLQIQVKLLRAIETKTFYRVGGTQSVKSDFRLVAATNRRLADEVAAGRFRQDLYYRLNVIPIELPPLRERGSDILLLARHFLLHYSNKYRRRGLVLSRSDEDRLLNYPWPGNVRQLKNVIERAVILSESDMLILDLPAGRPNEENAFCEAPTMDELQRRYILHTLEKTRGRIYGPGGAAEILGMKRSTLYKRMYKLGIKVKES